MSDGGSPAPASGIGRARGEPDVDPLDRLLDQRRARQGRMRRLGGITAAVLLHATVVGAVVLGPRFWKPAPKIVDFVPVQLVPAPRRGVENPPAAPRAPKPQPTSTPPPQPAPSSPPAPAPTIVEKPAKTEKPEKPQPQPQPSVAPRAVPEETPPPSRQPPGPPGALGAPNGRADSPFTATVGGVDNPSFTYGYYLDRMLLLIRNQWTRPSLGSGVETVVHFRIQRDGTVDEIQLVTSSGYNSFDLAALRAVQAAAPLPPLPRSYREGELGVNLIFR
jgi:protein TonB